MDRILKCLENCMSDANIIFMGERSKKHPSYKYPHKHPYQHHERYQQIMDTNRSDDSVSSQLSLSPICENIAPIEHEFGPANRAIYHKCVQCRDKGIHNRDIFSTCRNCDYTLCRDCYYGLSSTIIMS